MPWWMGWLNSTNTPAPYEKRRCTNRSGALRWGLSCQARPGTIVLLDEAWLDPNPFDAEPAHPIVLAPAGVTPVTPRSLRELRHWRARHQPPVGTVLWRTHGLDVALADARRREAERWPGAARIRRDDGLPERVRLLSGVIAVSAVPDRLRALAVDMARMRDYWYNGQSYVELDWPDGEVQIWREYHRMVSIARTARAEVLTGPGTARLTPDGVREQIWRQTAAVRRRRYGPRQGT
jgi:hypothetical protein